MNKKQTVFLSALLGIGSIMMLSFLIISAIKADSGCTVSDNLTVTGTTTIGDELWVAGDTALSSDLVVYGDTTLNGLDVIGSVNVSQHCNASQYCDESGNNCHDASDGWEGGSIPSGFCVFSDTVASCPSGWTRKLSFDGRTIKGNSTPGGTGGSDTHTHNFEIPYSPSGASGSGPKLVSSDGDGDFTTDSASSWPPYVEVIICCKN